MSNIRTKLANEIGRTVIETWQSDDGVSWYRKWSDGWIEQGGDGKGNTYTSPVALTFQIPFSTANYTISAVCVDTTSNNWAKHVYFSGKTTTGAKATTTINGTNGAVMPFNWYACGY